LTRRNAVRLALLAVLVALGALLFLLGKEHQLFIDNQNVTVSGRELAPIESLRVSVAGGEPMEFMADDRDVTVVRGPRASIRVEVLDQDGKVLKTVDASLSFSFEDRAMISLPALVEGLPYRLEPPGAQ